LEQGSGTSTRALSLDAKAAEEWPIASVHHLREVHVQTTPEDEFGTALIEQVATLGVYARRLAGAGADADDLLQDTMLRCWTARASLTPGTSLIAWGRTIMRNRFLTGKRRARFQADMPDGAIDRLLNVAESQGHAVDLRDVGWALTELAPEQREAVLLAGQGVEFKVAASQLGIPEGTFRSRVARGRTRLRLLIEERGTPLLSDRQTTDQNGAERSRPRRDWTGVMIG
jgi:RNA polymerase sigma-70 factor (ECF subfamily)